MVRPPTLIIGDLHLGPAAPGGTDAAAVELLERYRGSELVCLGDLFDLSAEIGNLSPCESVSARFETFPSLTQALRRHLQEGGAIRIIAGNHDAELGSAGVAEFLLKYLDASEPTAVKIAPWWLRHHGLHLEHGHVWDEDNAPIHPLAAPRHEDEPLGVALTRQVLAPTGAFQFAHAHQTTPLVGLLRVIRDLGVAAPEIVLRYFAVGATIFWRAVCHEHAQTEREGTYAIAAYARAQGLSRHTVERLLELRPTPRHADPAATFARLYFDRALAGVLSVTSVAAGAAMNQPGYLLCAAAGALYLRYSRGQRAHRYSGSLLKRVESAAHGLRQLVNARTVVFGHTHVPQVRNGYVNAGAFGFPGQRGRPFLIHDESERLTRGWLGTDLELEPLQPSNVPT